MLNVNVKPLTSSDIQVSVTYDGRDGSDPPMFVAVNEFDASGHQLDTGGWGSPLDVYYAVFHHLKPDTKYFYQLCETINTDAGQLSDCGTWNQYNGQTLSAPPPPSPSQQPTMTITRVQAFPAVLVRPEGQPLYFDKQNHMKLTWESNVEVTEVNVEITSSAGTTGINVGGTGAGAGLSGTIDDLSPPPPNKAKFGLLCTIRIRGQLSPGQWTPFSKSVQVQDPDNAQSMRGFMFASGIDASTGIKHLLLQTPGSPTQLPASFRNMMQI